MDYPAARFQRPVLAVASDVTINPSTFVKIRPGVGRDFQVYPCAYGEIAIGIAQQADRYPAGVFNAPSGATVSRSQWFGSAQPQDVMLYMPCEQAPVMAGDSFLQDTYLMPDAQGRAIPVVDGYPPSAIALEASSGPGCLVTCMVLPPTSASFSLDDYVSKTGDQTISGQNIFTARQVFDSIRLPNDAAAGKVLISDADGDAYWTAQTNIGGPITVKTYGAMGDGVTDDTAAIQMALDAGGTIVFPPGNYRITSTLDVPSGVAIEGTAPPYLAPSTFTRMGSWLKWDGSSSGTVLSISGQQNVSVRHIGIDGSRHTSGDTITGLSIQSLNNPATWYVEVHGCAFVGMNKGVVAGNGSYQSDVIRVVQTNFFLIWTACIEIDSANAFDTSTIANCSFYPAVQYGIHILHAGYLDIRSCSGAAADGFLVIESFDGQINLYSCQSEQSGSNFITVNGSTDTAQLNLFGCTVNEPVVANDICRINGFGNFYNGNSTALIQLGNAAARYTSVGDRFYSNLNAPMVSGSGQFVNLRSPFADSYGGIEHKGDVVWSNPITGGVMGTVVTRTGVTGTPWAALTAHDGGITDYVVPLIDNGHAYHAENAGTTGAVEPTWPVGAGATVVDGDITWKEHGASTVSKPWGPIGHGTGSYAPINARHEAGEVVWNNATASATDPIGWVCVTAGTPGTWEEMRLPQSGVKLSVNRALSGYGGAEIVSAAGYGIKVATYSFGVFGLDGTTKLLEYDAAAPAWTFVAGVVAPTVTAPTVTAPTIVGSASELGSITVKGTSHATAGTVYLNGTTCYVDASEHLHLGSQKRLYLNNAYLDEDTYYYAGTFDFSATVFRIDCGGAGTKQLTITTSGASFAVPVTAGTINVGPTVATTGNIRLAGDGSIWSLNSAGTGNNAVIRIENDGIVIGGGSTSGISLSSYGSVVLSGALVVLSGASVVGSTTATGTLTLKGTSHGTPGSITLNTSVVVAANGQQLDVTTIKCTYINIAGQGGINSHFVNSEFGISTLIGNNGKQVSHRCWETSGEFYSSPSTPAVAPADASLLNGSACFYLDETGHNLKVRVKYSDGTLKTGTVALS